MIYADNSHNAENNDTTTTNNNDIDNNDTNSNNNDNNSNYYYYYYYYYYPMAGLHTAKPLGTMAPKASGRSERATAARKVGF